MILKFCISCQLNGMQYSIRLVYRPFVPIITMAMSARICQHITCTPDSLKEFAISASNQLPGRRQQSKVSTTRGLVTLSAYCIAII